MIDDGLTEDERDNLLHEVHHLSHMIAERDEEIKILRNENALLEKWNGEIAFHARLFADALKRIDRMEAWKTQDSWDVLWAKIGIMRDIARAALEERT